MSVFFLKTELASLPLIFFFQFSGCKPFILVTWLMNICSIACTVLILDFVSLWHCDDWYYTNCNCVNANICVYVCKMCTRLNAAAQLVDILQHFLQTVSKLFPGSRVTESSGSVFSASMLYIRDITAALVNILAFRVRCHICYFFIFIPAALFLLDLIVQSNNNKWSKNFYFRSHIRGVDFSWEEFNMILASWEHCS